MVDRLTEVIRDPARLAALHETALLDSASEDGFDALTRLASRILRTPVALVVLVEEDRQFFKSHTGLPEPYDSTRQTPLTHSFCKHIVLFREPLVIEDAREHPDFRDNPAIEDLGVIAYLGIPLMTRDGEVLGSFCVIDHEPRTWSDQDIETMSDLAHSVATEIELRVTVAHAEHAARAQTALAEVLRQLGGAAHLGEVVDPVVKAAFEQTDALGAYVERIDGPSGEVEVVATEGSGSPLVGTRIPYPGSLTEEIIESGEPELMTELSAIGESVAPYLAESCRECRGLVVALSSEGRVLGALVLLRGPDQEPFQTEEAAFARALGDATSAAIRRVALLEELSESEERFSELAENVLEVFWIADPEFKRFLYVSPAYEDIWGRTVESVYDSPESWMEAVHLEDRDRPRDFLRALSGGEEVAVEYRILRPDGETRWLWVRGFPVMNESGELYRVVGVTEDITERKEREDALGLLAEAGRVLSTSLETEETLRTVARLAVESIADWCVVDVVDDGRIRRVSIGHSDPVRAEFAREYLHRYPPDPDAPAGVARVLRTGDPELLPEIPEERLREVARDEEHFRILKELGMRSAMIVPMISRGRILGAISLVAAELGRHYDQDDLAFAEELAGRAALAVDNARLYESAERRATEEAALRRATEAVGAAYSVEDVIRQIAQSALEATGADGAFVKRLAIESSEVEVVAAAGERTPEVGSRTPYAGSFTERVIEREEPEIIENIAEASRPVADRLIEDCGDCSALIVPLLDAGEPIGSLVLLRRLEKRQFKPDEIARALTFGNLASITFRRLHLFEESERRREELERVTESRARLMRGFSHDVKNPLGAADGNAQLLEKGFAGELDEQQKETVAQIRRSIRAALGLIEDLLQLARAEAGQVEIQWVATDVREAAREVAEAFRAQAEATGLAMETHLPREFPVIESDPGRVRQVLGNLISNAIKYTAEGRVDVTVGLREEGPNGHAGRWIAVDIADTGRGIPPEKRKLLFQEFARLDPEGERGAGIGLAISRRIAEALGGVITMESEVAKGSTFTLWLPMTPEGEEEQRQKEL
jgi:PAS domain S-box-containing protein